MTGAASRTTGAAGAGVRRVPGHDTSTHGVGFWLALVAGGAIMAFGLWGLARDIDEDLLNWAVFFVAGDVVHDLVVAPAVGITGWLLIRRVPEPWRAPLQAGLLLTAFVLLVGAIPLLDLGGNPANPTIRPLNYTTSTLTAVGIVWGVVVVTLMVGWARRRSGLAGSASVPGTRSRAPQGET